MNRLWSILAVLAILFPFVAVGLKVAETESGTTAAVFAVMALIFFGALLFAPRLTIPPETPEPGSGAAARLPAPPVAWSWDGVNRQPGEEDPATNGQEETHHA